MLEFKLILKGEGGVAGACKFLVASQTHNDTGCEFFVLPTIHIRLIIMFLQTSNKAKVILCSATVLSLYGRKDFYLYMKEKTLSYPMYFRL